MARKRLTIRSSSNVRIGQEMTDILKERVLASVRRVLGAEIDKEVSKIFRFVASQMSGGSNFGVIQPYLPQRWTPYTQDYRKYKTAKVGHLRWFSLTGQLQQQIGGVSEQRFLRGVGATKVSISRGKDTIKARVAPKLQLRRFDLETDLYGRGLLSRESWVKLLGRQRRYRAVMGPVFQYFIDQRIPRVIRRTLKGQV